MCHYKEVSAIREAVDEGRFHFLRASLGSVFDAYVYKIQVRKSYIESSPSVLKDKRSCFPSRQRSAVYRKPALWNYM